MKSMAGADGPVSWKAKNGFPGVIRSSRRRKAGSIPRNLDARRMEAAAGQADIKSVEILIAGILKMIFSGNVNLRLGMRLEGNVNILLYDDVAWAQRRGTTRKTAGHEKQESERAPGVD